MAPRAAGVITRVVVFALGALLLVRVDPAFPASFKTAWTEAIRWCDNDKTILFVGATNAWGALVYWSVGAAYTVFNFTQQTWIERYRVQPTKNVPVVDTAKFFNAVAQVLFNQVFVGPLLAYGALRPACSQSR